MSLPCVKGGGSRKRDGGIVKNKIIPKNNPSVTFGDSVNFAVGKFIGGLPPSLLHKGAFFMFIYAVSIFLTSTAFVDTKAKPRTMRGERVISIFQVVLSFLVLDALFLQR